VPLLTNRDGARRLDKIKPGFEYRPRNQGVRCHRFVITTGSNTLERGPSDPIPKWD
jgi:hypothetical protein